MGPTVADDVDDDTDIWDNPLINGLVDGIGSATFVIRDLANSSNFLHNINSLKYIVFFKKSKYFMKSTLN